jgi:NitT/TauT family transport system permease protein
VTRLAGRARALAAPVAGAGVLLAIWEALAQWIQFLLFPHAGETAVAVFRLLSSPGLWAALAASNQALVVGFAAAIGIGVPLGLAAGSNRIAGRWIDAYVNVLIVLPTAALAPLVFLFLPPGLTARVLVVAIFATPVVVQYAALAIRDIDPQLRDVARVFGATPAQTLRRIVLPAAAPGLLLGARLGLSRALEGMIVVELLMVSAGLGEMLLTFQARFEAASMYAVIVVLMAEAALLSRLGRACSHLLAPHQAERRT